MEKRVGGVAGKELTVDCLFATWLLWIMTVSSPASTERLGRGSICLPARDTDVGIGCDGGVEAAGLRDACDVELLPLARVVERLV